jgi:hypothetical protein
VKVGEDAGAVGAGRSISHERNSIGRLFSGVEQSSADVAIRDIGQS